MDNDSCSYEWKEFLLAPFLFFLFPFLSSACKLSDQNCWGKTTTNQYSYWMCLTLFCFGALQPYWADHRNLFCAFQWLLFCHAYRVSIMRCCAYTEYQYQCECRRRSEGKRLLCIDPNRGELFSSAVCQCLLILACWLAWKIWLQSLFAYVAENRVLKNVHWSVPCAWPCCQHVTAQCCRDFPKFSLFSRRFSSLSLYFSLSLSILVMYEYTLCQGYYFVLLSASMCLIFGVHFGLSFFPTWQVWFIAINISYWIVVLFSSKIMTDGTKKYWLKTREPNHTDKKMSSNKVVWLKLGIITSDICRFDCKTTQTTEQFMHHQQTLQEHPEIWDSIKIQIY